MFIKDFFDNHIRFKRNIDNDIEEIWDLMICGHANSSHPVSGAKKLLYFFINIAGIVLAFLGMMATATVTGPEVLILFALVAILPVIVNSILQATVKITWLSIILCLVSSFVLGLLIGLIGRAL